MQFDQWSLHPAIVKAVTLAGYTVPTEIQAQAIPVALTGVDILASAATGTGKTAAFVLPALQRLSIASPVSGSKGPRVLVLAPTRELAIQVTRAARGYGKFLKRVSVVGIVGGVPYHRQRAELSRTVEMMVATPGRLMDYMKRGVIDFRRIELLVLDEADRMLDMGFRDAVEEISNALPKPHQTLLFSATLGGSVQSLVRRVSNTPVRIKATVAEEKNLQIEQQLYYVNDLSDKKRLLGELLTKKEVGQTIVFTATKRSADELAHELASKGVTALAMHSDMKQRERTRTITRLREGDLRVIVATDVAARGINVPTITHVINFDIPREPKDYVHRIGRTGRAGASGTAILLVYPKERRIVSEIEAFIGHDIKALSMPGFEVRMEELRDARLSRGRSTRRPYGHHDRARAAGRFEHRDGQRASRNSDRNERSKTGHEWRPSIAKDSRRGRSRSQNERLHNGQATKERVSHGKYADRHTANSPQSKRPFLSHDARGDKRPGKARFTEKSDQRGPKRKTDNFSRPRQTK